MERNGFVIRRSAAVPQLAFYRLKARFALMKISRSIAVSDLRVGQYFLRFGRTSEIGSTEVDGEIDGGV